jgi:hypothetical protein
MQTMLSPLTISTIVMAGNPSVGGFVVWWRRLNLERHELALGVTEWGQPDSPE